MNRMLSLVWPIILIGAATNLDAGQIIKLDSGKRVFTLKDLSRKTTVPDEFPRVPFHNERFTILLLPKAERIGVAFAQDETEGEDKLIYILLDGKIFSFGRGTRGIYGLAGSIELSEIQIDQDNEITLKFSFLGYPGTGETKIKNGVLGNLGVALETYNGKNSFSVSPREVKTGGSQPNSAVKPPAASGKERH